MAIIRVGMRDKNTGERVGPELVQDFPGMAELMLVKADLERQFRAGPWNGFQGRDLGLLAYWNPRDNDMCNASPMWRDCLSIVNTKYYFD